MSVHSIAIKVNGKVYLKNGENLALIKEDDGRKVRHLPSCHLHLFLFHPSHSGSVAEIANRSDLMALCLNVRPDQLIKNINAL